MKVSKVSVSRSALPPHLGQIQEMKLSIFLMGEPLPSNSTSTGNTTGNSASGTAEAPQVAQLMIGIGVPQ
jgi:hypothetical protein